MSIRSRVIAVVVALIALLAILTLVGWRWGIVQFNHGVPSIAIEKLLNRKPSLDRAVNFPADFPEEAKTKWNEEVEADKAQIKKDNQAAAWFDLAIMYRMVNDYDGAVAIWKYLQVQYPTDPVAPHNLGEYYFSHKKRLRSC